VIPFDAQLHQALQEASTLLNDPLVQGVLVNTAKGAALEAGKHSFALAAQNVQVQVERVKSFFGLFKGDDSTLSPNEQQLALTENLKTLSGEQQTELHKEMEKLKQDLGLLSEQLKLAQNNITQSHFGPGSNVVVQAPIAGDLHIGNRNYYPESPEKKSVL